VSDGFLDLESACVRGRVYTTGALFTEAEFRLGSDRWVRPLAQAPWSGKPNLELPGHLRRLGGEFFCLPFGGGGAIREPAPGWEDLAKGPVKEPMHGPAANNDWAIVEYCGNEATLALDAPLTSPIKHLERRIALASDRPRVDIVVSIEMRRSASLPIAFHPILRLPENPRTLHLDIDFALGLTYPGIIEPDRMLCEPGKTFTSLARVPARSRGTVDLLSFPLGARIEDVVMLAGVCAPIRARFIEEDFKLEIDWSRSLLPHCMVWIHDRGLDSLPWEGRFRGLGLEPMAAAFDGPCELSVGPNPLTALGFPTSLLLSAENPTELYCSLTVGEM
jgi:hypothetical protein